MDLCKRGSSLFLYLGLVQPHPRTDILVLFAKKSALPPEGKSIRSMRARLTAASKQRKNVRQEKETR